MRENGEKLPALETVDQEIEGGFRSLLFAPSLERFHEDETRRDRERYCITCGQIAIVLYNLFLLCDWQMTPDVFRAALIARIGIFTPLLLVTWFVIARGPTPRVREGLSSAVLIISVILPMWVLASSRSPDLATYQYSSVLIMLFTAVVQRLRFRYAVFTLVCILIVQIITAMNLHGMTFRLLVTVITSFATAFVFLSWAAYSIERELRRGYLLDLRSRILNDQLDRIAKQDALTGLWNRRHLETTMAAAWADASLAPRPISAILLDIDHFKAFNDSYGHLEGDECLRQVASCVRAAVDGDDMSFAVRYGGEEFLVCVDGADTTVALGIAERIQEAIKTRAIRHPVLGDARIVTASFGVATGQAPEVTLERLVAAADDALYGAKRAGRDRIVVGAVHASLADKIDLRIAS